MLYFISICAFDVRHLCDEIFYVRCLDICCVLIEFFYPIGLSHLVAYIDQAIRHSRHEASFVDHGVANFSQMQKDYYGTSRQHSQVPPSSYSQPFHDRHGSPYMAQNDTFGPGYLHSNVPLSSNKQSQPSTKQPPQYEQFQPDTNSDFSGISVLCINYRIRTIKKFILNKGNRKNFICCCAFMFIKFWLYFSLAIISTSVKVNDLQLNPTLYIVFDV